MGKSFKNHPDVDAAALDMVNRISVLSQFIEKHISRTTKNDHHPFFSEAADWGRYLLSILKAVEDDKISDKDLLDYYFNSFNKEFHSHLSEVHRMAKKDKEER